MTRNLADEPMRPNEGDPADYERHQEIARCLFRESSDALFLFDPETHRVLDLNPAALRLTGYGREQVRGFRLWDLFAGESAAHLERLIDAYRRTGFYHSREGFTLAKSAGGTIPVNLSVSRIHTRPTPIGLVIARDVSERKRAEETLRRSEEQYRGLVESARVIFWSIGADGRVASLNTQFLAVTGWNPEAWVGRPLSDLILADDRGLAEAMVARAQSGEVPGPVELRVASRSGATLHVEIYPSAVAREPGGFGLSGVARDVTEARRAALAIREAEALEAARASAEAADRAKSAFLSQFSHEIRTPLTAILGFTDVLLHDPDIARLPPDRVEDLEIIERNGTHLLAIINDILDLSQVESGRLRIVASEFSPAKLVAEVADTLLARARSKGLQIVVEVDATTPGAFATDPVRFRQVVLNLASNAVSYTSEGRITLRVSGAADGGSGALAVVVADTGPGIDPDALAHLFEPFYRPPSSTSTGSGLGLAISRRLAEALGGRIDVATVPGRGSTFALILPPAPPSNTGPPPLSAVVARSVEVTPRRLDARVLLAEDNPSLQRVTALQLERVGATVRLAKNGQEALDAAISAQGSGHPFDVVLMDMQMPVMDGYEATRQLRAQGFAGLIVALTAYAMPEDREECLRMGCDEHLAKPIDWARLRAVIEAKLAVEPST